MHLFASAGDVVLTPGVALKCITPEAIHLACFGALVLARRKTSKTKQTSTFLLKFRKGATETIILAYQTDVSVSFTHAGIFIW
jgi:hypothetical protein